MSKDTFENPFGNPAFTSINTAPESSGRSTSGATGVDTAGLGDYNPFELNSANLSGQINPAPGVPPPYTSYDAQKLTSAELERRQRELEAKAAELDRREQEQNLRSLSGSAYSKNWPPLPSFCPCKPCFYQDIGLEIGSDYVKVVQFGYYLWIAYSILLAINLIGAFAVFVGSSNTSGGTLFGISILVLLFCLPASYVCWFRPLYKAFKNNSSINFFVFFIVFGAQIIVMGIQALGITSWGSCGWLTALSVVKTEPGVAGVTIPIAVIFTAITVVSVLFLMKVHAIYRNTGASFVKAREEFSRGIVTDPTLRSATMEAGLMAARQATGANSSSNR